MIRIFASLMFFLLITLILSFINAPSIFDMTFHGPRAPFLLLEMMTVRKETNSL